MFQPKGEFIWGLFIPMLVLLLIVAGFIFRNIRFIRSSVRVEGIIIGYETVPVPRSQSVSAPLIQFTDETGKTRQLLAKVRSNPPSGKVGDKVALYYQASDPSQARLGTFKEMWLHVLVLGIIFGIFFILWFGIWMGSPVPASSPMSKHAPASPQFDPEAEEFEQKKK